MRKELDGSGRIDLFADGAATRDDRQVLTRFTHDHLHRYADQVERFRIYTCGECGTPANDLALVARRLRKGASRILCQECESPIALWDDLEREFASDELRAVVLDQERLAQAVIERETRTQLIIADVIATAGRANQLARQVDRPRPGVQIIFVDDHGQPTDRHAFVHVDPDPLPADRVVGVDPTWADHPTPILYAARARDDDPVVWMDATEALHQARTHGSGPVQSLPFEGQRLDVMSVRELRQRLLAPTTPPTTKPATRVAPVPAAAQTTVQEQDDSATARSCPVAPPETTAHQGEPASDTPGARLRDRVWAWVVAAATIASLIGLGLAIAALR